MLLHVLQVDTVGYGYLLHHYASMLGSIMDRRHLLWAILHEQREEVTAKGTFVEHRDHYFQSCLVLHWWLCIL